MQLSSHQAQKVIEGAEGKAREMGLPVVIAVLDAGAHLKAFRRMDGAVLGSIDIALRKARTAVCSRPTARPSGSTANPARRHQASNSPTAAWLRSAAASRSSRPDGQVIGALGVSGGAVAQDMDIAKAGFAAFEALTH